jgi:hypothetical protein
MGRAHGLLALMGVIGAAAAMPASAAEEPPLISADTSRLGRIDLYLADVEGTKGTFFELVGERRVRIGEITVDRPTAVHIPDALTWSCTRRTRRIVADVVHPDGTTASADYVVRTPGCRDRFLLRATRTARPGTRVAVTVADRWTLGDVSPRLCVHSPSGKSTCRAVRFAGAPRSTLPVTLTRDGRWTLDLVLGRSHLRRTLSAGLPAEPGAGAARPVMLVTGDSTVQGIDTALGDRLRNSVHLLRDFRPGSGISHAPDRWTAYAAREAKRYRPRITVISVGAADGYPMRRPDGTTVACCSDAWRAEYARRVRAIMRSYDRDGRGRTLWLTLPRPEDPDRAGISIEVNAAVEAAAAAVPSATVVQVDDALTPDWRFRRTMRYRGRRRVVRTPDGIHLTPAGAAIATDLILRALSRTAQRSG